MPPIPTDLARCLGPEGVKYLWNHTMETRAYPKRSEDWHIHLPYLIQNLLLELSKWGGEDPSRASKSS